MKNTGTLTVTTPSDRKVQMVRVFDAPRRLVFDALTKPELLPRWFGKSQQVVLATMTVAAPPSGL